MDEQSAKIGNCLVAVTQNSLTEMSADAYVVSQYRHKCVDGGVAKGVQEAGASTCLSSFQEFIDENGAQPFGAVYRAPAGGGNAKNILHVVAALEKTEEPFATVDEAKEVVQNAFYNALVKASEDNICRIVAPAMGTGPTGKLTSELSGEVMMQAIKRYADEDRKPLAISFAVRGDEAYQAFTTALTRGSQQPRKSLADIYPKRTNIFEPDGSLGRKPN